MKFKKDIVTGVVKGVYFSVNPDKTYKGDDYFFTKAVEELRLTTEGVVGDRHFGYEAISGGRLTAYRRGTTVRNNRQWSAISPAELQVISRNLGVEMLTPELLGINLLIDGIDNLTKLPPMTYLFFSQHEGDFVPGRPEDVGLVVYGEALPCRIAGRGIAQAIDEPFVESRFSKDAMNHRGVTGWVEKGGIIMPGYTVSMLKPTGQD